MRTDFRLLPLVSLLAALAGSSCVLNPPGGGGGNTRNTRLSWVMPQGVNGCVTPFNEPLGDVVLNIGGVQSQHTCQAGRSPSAVTLFNLPLGLQPIDVQARDSNGFVYYRFQGQVNVLVGGSDQTFSLQHIAGSLGVGWYFVQGSTSLNCAQAGVDLVAINLIDSTGARVYSDWQTLPCSNLNQVMAGHFPALYAGNYAVELQGRAAGQWLYRSIVGDQRNNVSVAPGVFFGPPNANSTVFNIPMVR